VSARKPPASREWLRRMRFPESLSAPVAGRQPSSTKARWDKLVPPYQTLAAEIG